MNFGISKERKISAFWFVHLAKKEREGATWVVIDRVIHLLFKWTIDSLSLTE